MANLYPFRLTKRLGLVLLSITLTASFESASQSVTVDPTTGGLNVRVPLHTLKYGSVEIPVSLVYGSNGLRVEEGDGDAGLGWNLTCKYGVFRQVRGLPDEVNTGMRTGWLVTPSGYPLTNGTYVNNFIPNSNDDLSSSNWSDEATDFSAVNAFGYTRDTEPDIYTISGPGLFVRFVYDASGVIRMLEHQDLSITPGVSGFTVVNNLGHTYLFTTKEDVGRSAMNYKGATVDMFTTEYNYYKNGTPSFVGTWHLTSVTDETGKVVNFNYTALPATTSTRYQTRIKVHATNPDAPDTLYTVVDSFTPKALTSITGGNYTVAFDWTSNNRLSAVKVSESGLGDGFQYGFTYQSAKAITNTSPPEYLHAFLTEVKMISTPDCIAQVPYKFSYQGVGSALLSATVDFSWDKLHGQDMFGFYNGIKETSTYLPMNVVPKLYVYAGQSDSRRFSFHTQSGQTLTQTLEGTNRTTIAAKIGIGSLIRVVYPTGGYTKINWERNKYLDSLAGNKVLYGPGLRVASTVTSGGDAAYNRAATISNSYHDVVTTYSYSKSNSDTTTSGIILYPPSFGFSTGSQFIRTLNDQGPGSHIGYRRVKESISGQGSRVFIYSYPAVYPSTSYSTDWVASKSKVARNQTSHMTLTNVQNGYYTFPFAPNPNYDFSHGLMTSLSEYSETGTLMRQKQISYLRIYPALSSVYGLKFEYFTTDCDCFHFSRYKIIVGTNNVISQEVVREADDAVTPSYSVTTTNYIYNSDIPTGNFLLKDIQTIMGDGAVSTQSVKYVKDFAAITTPRLTDEMAKAVKAMVDARRHGEVVEQHTTYVPSGGTTSYVNGSLQLYKKDVATGKVFPYRTYSFPKGAALTPAAIIPGVTQGFLWDTDYFLTSSHDDFDAQWNPATITDDDKNVVGLHHAQNYMLPPVATFTNATAKQAVYEGFEFATGRNLTATQTLTYATGWTGERAAILAPSNSVFHNIVDNNGKPYRVSCYVKAAQNSTITFKFFNGTTELDSTALLYQPSVLNTWVYLEGLLNVTSGTPAQVKVTVTSNATVTIDDIIVRPRDAAVSAQTFLPFKGTTSQTDDRGFSTTVSYDVLGRKVNVFDRHRNLVELNEYIAKGLVVGYVYASFQVPNVVAGIQFTATASTFANCYAGAQYQWKIGSFNVGGNTSQLTWTIPLPGQYTLSLTATNPATGMTSTTTQNVCVAVNSSAPSFTFTNDTENNTKCHNDGHAIFTISAPVMNCGTYTSTTDYKWEVSVNGAAYETLSSTISSMSYFGGIVGYFSVRATVTQTCSGPQGPQCNGSTVTTSSQTVQITVEDCTN
jgi:hypothetical protein